MDDLVDAPCPCPRARSREPPCSAHRRAGGSARGPVAAPGAFIAAITPRKGGRRQPAAAQVAVRRWTGRARGWFGWSAAWPTRPPHPDRPVRRGADRRSPPRASAPSPRPRRPARHPGDRPRHRVSAAGAAKKRASVLPGAWRRCPSPRTLAQLALAEHGSGASSTPTSPPPRRARRPGRPVDRLPQEAPPLGARRGGDASPRRAVVLRAGRGSPGRRGRRWARPARHAVGLRADGHAGGLPARATSQRVERSPCSRRDRVA